MTKPNKPQLSEEMEKRLTAEIKLLLYEYNQGNDDSRIVNVVECVDDILATAIEEQRQGYIEKVEMYFGSRNIGDKHLDIQKEVLSILKKEKQL